MKAKKLFSRFGKQLIVALVAFSMLIAFLPGRVGYETPDTNVWDIENMVLAVPDPNATRSISVEPRNSILTPITVGSGTADDPYIIHTGSELAWLSTRLDVRGYSLRPETIDWEYWSGPRHFRLANDIDISDFHYNHVWGWDGWNGWVDWMPIGGNEVWTIDGWQTVSFGGVFDGDGHTIRGLYINSNSHVSAPHGLFSIVTGTIKNLNVEGSVIVLEYARWEYFREALAGGIAGMLTSRPDCNIGGMIINSSFNGDVHARGIAGGIVGTMNQATIRDSYTTGSIVSIRGDEDEYYSLNVSWIGQWRGYAGGIVGRVFSGSIVENNTSSAQVSSDCGGWWHDTLPAPTNNSVAGGIVGRAFLIPPNSENSIIIANNRALNPFVQTREGASNSTGRIVGSVTNNPRPILYGNHALVSMHTNGGSAFNPHYANAHDTIHGEDITGDITGTTLIAGRATGQPGNTVRIPISLINNPGIAGFNITITYDTNLLSPANLDDAAIRRALGGAVFVSNIDTNTGIINAVWASPHETTAATLFPIYFTINENAPVNPRQSITSQINISINEMKHLNHNDVDAVAHNGAVTISIPPEGGGPTPAPSPGNGGPTPTPSPGNDDPLWGDVNQDGVIDILDLIRLAQHIANTPGMQLTGVGLTVADVFYDGDVNLSDLIHLARYLASADMNNPDVILGPTSN